MAKKYYVVWRGHQTGITDNWEKCKKMVEGFTGAKYKGFPSLSEAEAALKNEPSAKVFYQSAKSQGEVKRTDRPLAESLSVDAACSGNPGVMEYRGVYTGTGEEWFRQKYPLGTNNIGEFLAIVHGLAELKRRNILLPVYTDSVTALSWIRQKKCKSKLERTPETESLFAVVERAEKWLLENQWANPLLKWDTERWGEIPADFGRK